MKTLADQWDSFRLLVVPADAGATQVREMRRAFYAGAEAMRATLMSVPDGDVEEMAACDAIQAELERFALDVREGRA
jgi:hypothetical protein